MRIYFAQASKPVASLSQQYSGAVSVKKDTTFVTYSTPIRSESRIVEYDRDFCVRSVVRLLVSTALIVYRYTNTVPLVRKMINSA